MLPPIGNDARKRETPPRPSLLREGVLIGVSVTVKGRIRFLCFCIFVFHLNIIICKIFADFCPKKNFPESLHKSLIFSNFALLWATIVNAGAQSWHCSTTRNSVPSQRGRNCSIGLMSASPSRKSSGSSATPAASASSRRAKSAASCTTWASTKKIASPSPFLWRGLFVCGSRYSVTDYSFF